MEDSKRKEKLSTLPDTQGVLSKIKAVFSATRATADESEVPQHLPGYIPLVEVGAYQSEAERLQAKAQEMAERIRRRMI